MAGAWTACGFPPFVAIEINLPSQRDVVKGSDAPSAPFVFPVTGSPSTPRYRIAGARHAPADLTFSDAAAKGLVGPLEREAPRCVGGACPGKSIASTEATPRDASEPARGCRRVAATARRGRIDAWLKPTRRARRSSRGCAKAGRARCSSCSPIRSASDSPPAAWARARRGRCRSVTTRASSSAR